MSISCTVKHVQHIGIIRGFCLPGGLVKIFSAWEGGGLEGDRKKQLACDLQGGSISRLTLCWGYK